MTQTIRHGVLSCRSCPLVKMTQADGAIVTYCDADEERREVKSKPPGFCPLRSHDIEFEGRVYFQAF